MQPHPTLAFLTILLGVGNPAAPGFGSATEVNHQGLHNCTVSCFTRFSRCIVTNSAQQVASPEVHGGLPHHPAAGSGLPSGEQIISAPRSCLLKDWKPSRGCSLSLHLPANTPQALSRAMLPIGEVPLALLCPAMLHAPQGQFEAS